MKNKFLLYSILLSVILLLIIDVFYSFKSNQRLERILSGVKVGGLALAENYDRIFSFQKELKQQNNTRNIDSLSRTYLSEYFRVYNNLEKDEIGVLLISKKHDDLVFYITQDEIIFYDKITYKLKEDLKIDYRLKFDEWLFEYPH